MDELKFEIFDDNKESYIIGDLLNMPYFFENWPNTPHSGEYMYSLFKKTATQYEANILGIYDKSRTDESEPIPNIKRLRDSVDTYIKNNIDCNKKLQKIIEICEEKDTLFVHLRSGDKGIVNPMFLDKIEELSKYYNKIIILCGIHQNADRSHYFPNVEESKNNMNSSLNMLLSKNLNVIIDLNEPDIHLSAMRRAKNLLVHMGGYSILGSLLFNGNNLYITSQFTPLERNNTELFTYIDNYTII